MTDTQPSDREVELLDMINSSVEVARDWIDELATDRDPQIYDMTEQIRILARYGCSQCWGRLRSKWISGDRNHVLIYCDQCGIGAGFHSWLFIEQQQIQSGRDLRDATRNLAGILPGLMPTDETTDPDQILNDLGF